jgi:hypothetical protein
VIPRAGQDTEARGNILFASAGTRLSSLPGCSQTLHWLSYPGPYAFWVSIAYYVSILVYSIDNRVISEWLWIGKDLVEFRRGLILRYYRDICLEVLRNTTKILNEESRSPGPRFENGTFRTRIRSDHFTCTWCGLLWLLWEANHHTIRLEIFTDVDRVPTSIICPLHSQCSWLHMSRFSACEVIEILKTLVIALITTLNKLRNCPVFSVLCG